MLEHFGQNLMCEAYERLFEEHYSRFRRFVQRKP